MRPWLKLTLCTAATLTLGWGVVRSLSRSAPITADWGGLGFVAVTLALMVLGMTATCVSLLRKPSHPTGEGRFPEEAANARSSSPASDG